VFDIGWQELLVIGLVAIVVVGPKDLPRVLRAVTLGIRKIRGMARDFQDGIDELAREADLQELRKEIEQTSTADLEKEFESIADPAREVEQSVREISGSINKPDDAAAAPTPAPQPVAKPASETPETPSTGARKAGDAS
jgi:sec-independent protein translocase protein TatB